MDGMPLLSYLTRTWRLGGEHNEYIVVTIRRFVDGSVWMKKATSHVHTASHVRPDVLRCISLKKSVGHVPLLFNHFTANSNAAASYLSWPAISH